MTRKKISVIGAGYTGATAAFMLAAKELGDVVLVDIPQVDKPTRGKALDMKEATPVLGADVDIHGTSDYSDTKDSDVVIITAGIARKPGMSRDDLVQTNQKVMTSVTKDIVKHSPDTTILVLTNPVDAMTYTVYKASGLPKEKVIGQSGVLDTARFCTFVAEELDVSVKDVTGFVLGGHGDDMVPLIRYFSVGGVPLTRLMSQEKIDGIIDRTRKGGAEIVDLLGSGSAYYAPAAALVQMTEAILKDQNRLLAAIALLEGEYGYEGLYLGVPVILGEGGIKKIVELELEESEKSELAVSKDSVLKVMDVLK